MEKQEFLNLLANAIQTRVVNDLKSYDEFRKNTDKTFKLTFQEVMEELFDKAAKNTITNNLSSWLSKHGLQCPKPFFATDTGKTLDKIKDDIEKSVIFEQFKTKFKLVYDEWIASGKKPIFAKKIANLLIVIKPLLPIPK